MSLVAAPVSIIFFESKFILEKAGPSFIVIPLIPPSRISVFEPAPKTTNFCGLVFSKKKITSSVLFGLKNISAVPPKLNQL